MITVFTPSYNRKKELKNLYESLKNQNYDNFEWLIVDDGSTDGTKEFIEKIKKNTKMQINYYYKENGGKQSAYNLGLDKAKGELFLCIDSDDILANSMIDTIKDDYEQIKNNPEIGGLMYLQGYINDKNKIIGTNFPKDEMIETYHDMYYKYKITGDKLIVLKTKVAREYYFPIIEKEKFVAEALIYNRISLKYKFLCLNKVGAYKEYLEGGYSNNYFSLVKRNPLGNALYFKELYDFEKTFYNVYGYILFSIYGKKSFLETIRNHKAKFKILVLYIPTLIISKLK